MSEPSLVTNERAMPGAQSAESIVANAVAPEDYGARLAWERERAGLGVTDVAAILRLHPNQVRAIEQEDLTRLPELAYVRGFIRSYARALNIDPAPILSDLNAKLAPAPLAGEGTPTNYALSRGGERERTSGLIVAFAVIGLIVLGVLGLQVTQRDALAPATTAAVPVAPSSSAATQAAPIPSEAPTAPQTEVAAPANSTVEPFPPADTQASAGTVAGAVAPVLMLRFDGAAWVEVTDATGKILLSQLSAVGAEHALDGALPLNVVIGDANKATVEVRGEAFNLVPVTKNNVARFTVR